MAAAALRRRIVQLPVAGAAAMSAHLRASVDQRPMTRFQWSVIALCMVLNMIDGFDVLVMAFTASAVSGAMLRTRSGWNIVVVVISA